MALIHNADTSEFVITTTSIPTNASRVLFDVPSGRPVYVEKERIARDADCAAVLTAPNLGYFRESYFSKELAEPPTEVLDFVELLKCLELVTDDRGRSECFLRAKANTYAKHTNAAATLKDRFDTVHMNSLPLAFLHGIKQRLDSKHYTDDEIDDVEFAKFKAYFDKIELPGIEARSFVNKEIVQGLETDLACDITTAIRIVPTIKVSDVTPDGDDASARPGTAKGTWEFTAGFTESTDFKDIQRANKTYAERPRIIATQKRKRDDANLNEYHARNEHIAKNFDEVRTHKGGLTMIVAADVDASKVKSVQFGNKVMIVVPYQTA